MKISHLTTALLAAGLVTGCINVNVYKGCPPKHHEGKEAEDQEDEDEGHHAMGEKHEAGEDEDERSEAKLKAGAKISEADAKATAMTKVPNGTLKESELEMEKGKLIWSLCFTTPGTKNITEVNVNAIDGSIVNIETEKPSDEAKEADDEKGEKGDKD